MNMDQIEASPTKAVVLELQNLRAELREAVESFASRLEAEIDRLQIAIESGSEAKNLSSTRIRDLRDMLTLLGQRQIKPGKGRRKDLKKIESVVGDIAMLIENW
jgi:type IV pilus biogenesis protein CpaD/CtpE